VGFETDRDDTKSQTGYVFVLNGGTVDRIWLQKLPWKLFGLGSLSQGLRGARHYHRRYHYVRGCVELGEIRILKVLTDNNLAHPFIKALSNRKLTQHPRSMGLHPASSFM
ncbi:hypothetical protein Tco_0220578, partial [Tanacetum coccineum]